MTHFVERCECGKVVRQCRCPATDKVERVIWPCTHEDGVKTDEIDVPLEPETGALPDAVRPEVEVATE